jgi:tetratricopeptide (TPR) repeat protein
MFGSVTAEDWKRLLSEASNLRRQGKVADATAAYRRLLAANPELPDSWYNLALLQRQARDFEAALASYSEALSRGVRDPQEVHLNRAVILSDHLARPDEARAELDAALSLKPDYVPALLNLGNLHEDRGDRLGAGAAYRRALEIEPEHPVLLSRLAGISHMPELDEALAGRLRAAIGNPQTRSDDAADLGFAFAGLLDAAGRFDDAFDAATAANQASRAASGARYDRTAAEAFVDRSIATFRSPITPSAEPAPIFIVGMFRSGSTLVEQILASSGAIHPAGELEFIGQLVAAIPGYPESLASADDATVGQWREIYRRGLERVAPSVDLVTDKRPDNFLHVGLIKTLFPSAKIVHTRRNRLDNLLSLYFLHLDPGMAYALDLADAAHWYVQYERLMAYWKALYPDDIFDVDYDELVRAPEPLLKRLFGFLGIGWRDDALQFSRSDRPIRTASVWQVRAPLHARSSGRSRNYSKKLRAVSGAEGD